MSLKETINQKFIEAFKTREAIKRFPYEIMKQRITWILKVKNLK